MKDPRFNIDKKLYDIKPPQNNRPKSDFLARPASFPSAEKTKITFAKSSVSQRDVDYDFSSLKSKKQQKQKPDITSKKQEPDSKNIVYKKKPKIRKSFLIKNIVFSALVVILFFAVLYFAFFFGSKNVKELVLQNSIDAYKSVKEAQERMLDFDFEGAGFAFSEAYQKFSYAQKMANNMGASLIDAFSWIPFLESISSKVNMLDVAVNLSYVGKIVSEAADPIIKMSAEDIFKVSSDKNDVYVSDNSFGNALQNAYFKLNLAKNYIDKAESDLKKINPYDFDQDVSEQIFNLKKDFPKIKKNIEKVSEYLEFSLWFLGQENPRHFLVVAQNTAEARATGGFIGSYGAIETEFGYIKDIFMDNVYNLDGQLYYKVVPPYPIQKISTAWSLHDSNWFLDFPTSAKKMMFFYEKAGAPTPDGIIAINEKFIERLLEITGPIELPEYGVVLTKDDFYDIVQFQVEENYDKEENKPKKILNDIVPVILSKLSGISNDDLLSLLYLVADEFKNKNIMFYANHPKYQDIILKNGWGGEILKNNDADYLAVVASNINGYKTDRVTKRSMTKVSEIQKDGSIINTLNITIKNEGKNSPYDWQNQVNSSYLRIYVPFGSELIEASGFTKEKYEAPIDYKKAGFVQDEDVKNSINSAIFRQDFGIDEFSESSKTVFAGWVYTSPGEKTEITLKYKLPFSLDTTKKGDDIDFVFEKQPGQDLYVDFKVKLPDSWSFIYSLPEGSWGEYSGYLKSDMILSVGINF